MSIVRVSTINREPDGSTFTAKAKKLACSAIQIKSNACIQTQQLIPVLSAATLKMMEPNWHYDVIMTSVVILSVLMLCRSIYAEWHNLTHYAECHYGKCRGNGVNGGKGWRQDTRQSDPLHNDSQHNRLNYNT